VCPGWLGVVEEVVAPPHPVSERQIIATSAQIEIFLFELIFFKVSKANPNFGVHQFTSVGTMFDH
jgi:hypothetical protein